MDLMELLPPIYSGNETMQELVGIVSGNIRDLTHGIDKAVDECFVSTASELLSRYEKIFGIQTDVSKPDELRRERVLAKIRGIGTVTKQMIQDTVAAYSNGEVEVIEDNANNSFTIKFVETKGLPPNMSDLILTIEEIKPAHLAYIFEYVYRTHAELSAYTHEQLSAYTHITLREGEMS